jgi:hypothetical protein
MKEDQQMSSTTNQCKKPYHKPQLEVYGDLREITGALGLTSKNADNGLLGLTKTH